MTVVWFRSPSGNASSVLSTSACDAPASSGAGGEGGAPRRPCANMPIDRARVTSTTGTIRFMITSRRAFYADGNAKCRMQNAKCRVHSGGGFHQPATLPRMRIAVGIALLAAVMLRAVNAAAPAPTECEALAQLNVTNGRVLSADSVASG